MDGNGTAEAVARDTWDLFGVTAFVTAPSKGGSRHGHAVCSCGYGAVALMIFVWLIDADSNEHR